MGIRYLPIDQCRHGWLYYVRGRNISLGVYDRDRQIFVGIREKFGSTFLEEERHVDSPRSEAGGAVWPLIRLVECPLIAAISSDRIGLLNWLREKELVLAPFMRRLRRLDDTLAMALANANLESWRQQLRVAYSEVEEDVVWKE